MEQRVSTYWRVVLSNGQIIQSDKLQISDGGTQVWMQENVVVIPPKPGTPVLKVEQCIMPFNSVLYMSEIAEVKETV